MSYEELDNQFDVLFNNITSNQAPGLNTYEKCVFLTKAQNEIVKNYFTANSKGNNIGQGFDDSAKRQADFSCLMKTSDCPDGPCVLKCTFNGSTEIKKLSDITLTDDDNNTLSWDDVLLEVVYTVSVSGADNDCMVNIVGKNYYVNNFPFLMGEEDEGTITKIPDVSSFTRIDFRSYIFRFPSDVFIVINETIKNDKGRYLQVVPLRYDTYTAQMSKPYKRPTKNQAWRLINHGYYKDDAASRYVEIVLGPGDTVQSYVVRYIRFPKPIIVGELDGLTIEGYEFGEPTEENDKLTQGCELDPILHEDILQRAVELAKIAWTNNGQDNMQPMLQTGTRSE